MPDVACPSFYNYDWQQRSGSHQHKPMLVVSPIESLSHALHAHGLPVYALLCTHLEEHVKD